MFGRREAGKVLDQFHSLFGLRELTVMGAKLEASYILYILE